MTEETHFCPSRATTPHYVGQPDFDPWQVRPNGDRCCSFCGSLHPDDWDRLTTQALDPDSQTFVERALFKDYKFYVHQDGVANANDGGIKFYAWHIPSQDWADRMNATWKDVQRVSGEKIVRRLSSLVPSRPGAK